MLLWCGFDNVSYYWLWFDDLCYYVDEIGCGNMLNLLYLCVV